jgi:hypothetical protein
MVIGRRGRRPQVLKYAPIARASAKTTITAHAAGLDSVTLWTAGARKQGAVLAERTLTVADRHYVMEHGQAVDTFRKDEARANMARLHEVLGV